MKKFTFLLKPLMFIISLLCVSWLVLYMEELGRRTEAAKHESPQNMATPLYEARTDIHSFPLTNRIDSPGTPKPRAAFYKDRNPEEKK